MITEMEDAKLRKAAEKLLLAKLEQDSVFNLISGFEVCKPDEWAPRKDGIWARDSISAMSQFEPSKSIEPHIEGCVAALKEDASKLLPDNRIIRAELSLRKVRIWIKPQYYLCVSLSTEHEIPTQTAPELPDDYVDSEIPF